MITEARLSQDCFTWHWNNYPTQRGQLFIIHNNPRNAVDGARLKAQGLVAGVADMCYLTNEGKPVFIELKLPKGVQSKNQKWWESVCYSVNVQYFIVRSLDQFKDLFVSLS